MALFKPVTLIILLIFFVSSVLAQDTDCFDELSHEVQMIKNQLKSQQNQQVSASKELDKQQLNAKTSFKGVGVLADALVAQLPNLSALKMTKQTFDHLNK